MPSYCWKKYCHECGYLLDGLEKNQCPECGCAFDPDDDSTWSKRPYNEEKVRRKRRRLAFIYASVVMSVAFSFAIVFPAWSLFFVIIALLPLGMFTFLVVCGFSADDMVQLFVGETSPVQEKEGKYRNPLESLVGKDGHVGVTLRPVGQVSIDGKQFEAKAEGKVLATGQKICVVEVRDNQLTVRSSD